MKNLGIVQSFMALFNLEEEGKVISFYQKVEKALLKEQKVVEFNYEQDKFKLENRISTLEDSIEEITHDTHIELSKNFITPFDREDIHSLIKSIDNVADYMHSAASKMRLYQVEKITKSIRKLTEINLEACQLIGVGIKELRDMKDHKAIKETCKKINKLESKADAVFDKAVADIFENESDAKNIIKYKEVLSALESASDKCKSVANVMEQISVKHS